MSSDLTTLVEPLPSAAPAGLGVVAVNTQEKPPAGEPVISVRGLSKCYHLYHSPGERLRAMITRKKLGREVWALRDVNFDVFPGDALGIIGRNGSGKSTLMQIIAGTVSPTTGEVRIRGRISAMLELGSGFNPHFTGRENVLLSGAILGFSRREMEQKLPEIEEFAEIGEFIDEPVSVYSSGMHARLAFSVSVSLKPDILILDEILSVGDAGFQQRCIGRLHQLRQDGVTLLFVSHAPDAVRSICRRGLLLSQGKQEFLGTASQAVNRYFGALRQKQSAAAVRKYEELAASAPPPPDDDELDIIGPSSLRYGTGHARFDQVRLLDQSDCERDGFQFGEFITVEVTFRSTVAMPKVDVTVRVRDKHGIEIFGVSANDVGDRIDEIEPGRPIRVRFTFKNILRAGPHGVNVSLIRPPDRMGDGAVTLDHIDAAAAFRSLSRGDSIIRGKIHHDCRVEWQSGV